MDKKDLKIQALVERIAAMTAQYESQDADRRVELTALSQELDSVKAQLAEKNIDVSQEDS